MILNYNTHYGEKAGKSIRTANITTVKASSTLTYIISPKKVDKN